MRQSEVIIVYPDGGVQWAILIRFWANLKTGSVHLDVAWIGTAWVGDAFGQVLKTRIRETEQSGAWSVR